MKNAPLANSFIGVSDENFKYLGGTVSNEEGYYEFFVDQPGTYYLGAQHNSALDSYIYDYILLTKKVETGEVLEIRTDFNLRPGGNIILYAYNNEGKLLRNKEFRTIIDSQAYVTDLNNLPHYGVFHGVHDDYSAEREWDWDLAIPAFLVLPQTLNKIHVQWEVPEFGKIMLSIDNEGGGYSVDEQGRKIVLNFNYEAAKSKIAALKRDYELFKSQGYNISDSINEDLDLSKEHLAMAEEYLSQVPTPDMEKAVKELNIALKYALWAHEQLHLEKAEADIEKYRKGNVILKIVDKKGKPVPNYDISFKQISHDFLFGANPMGKNSEYDVRYADILKEAGINYSYILFSWNIEPAPGVFDWGSIDNYQNIQAQVDQGFKLMGGLAMWFYRGSGLGDTFCPYYQDDMTFEELKENIYDHMYSLASRYRYKIYTWEINEQNLPWTNALDLTWNQKLETYKAFTNAVKDANPEAKIIFDSCALPYEFSLSKLEDRELKAGGISFPEFLGLILEEKIPIDVIDLEFYYSGVNTDGYVPPGLDLVSISNLLDQYSKFNKPIFVRELSAPSTQVSNSSWWHKSWDEETQAEYLKKFYTIAFSKPLVKEIGWSYGVSDEDSFIINGGLLDTNLNPKPSYYALKNIIDSWTTTGIGKTDEKGEFEFRGFAGDYDVTITSPDGYSSQVKVHVNEGIRNEFSFTLVLPFDTGTGTYPTPTPSPTPTPEEGVPGFEAFFAIAGLLAIAYLLRRRK